MDDEASIPESLPSDAETEQLVDTTELADEPGAGRYLTSAFAVLDMKMDGNEGTWTLGIVGNVRACRHCPPYEGAKMGS